MIYNQIVTWTAFAIFAMFQLVITYNQRFKGAVYQLRENFEMKLSRCNTTKGTDIEHLGDDNGQKMEHTPFFNPVQKEREDCV